MYFELKENKPHGTKDDPFSTYHIKNEGRSFQIPVSPLSTKIYLCL